MSDFHIHTLKNKIIHRHTHTNIYVHLFNGHMFQCDGCFNTIILFLFDSSCILDQLKGTHNEKEEKSGTEDDKSVMK